MGLQACCLVPHPPILVPEVGGAEASKVSATSNAFAQLAKQLEEINPQVVIAISPHGPVFSDGFPVLDAESVAGDLGMFRCPDVEMTVNVDRGLSELILQVGSHQGLPVFPFPESVANRYGQSLELDHGFLVPLYFLRQAPALASASYVLLGTSTLPFLDIYRFGKALAEAAEQDGRRVVLVASGDLSHRLTSEAPAGYDPAGATFDRQLMDLLNSGDAQGVLQMDREFAAAAGECGLRPLITALGALDGHRVNGKVLSYEGPFGVGYGVALLEPGEPTTGLVEQISEKNRKKMAALRAKESAPVRLARAAIEYFISEGTELPQEAVDGDPQFTLPSGLPQRAGVFVSIKQDGELRGCIGTIEPSESSLKREILRNAVLAATDDPRFPAIEEGELDSLQYSVDVLGEPEPIGSLGELDPSKYGIIVSSGHRRGLLLPDLAGIDTPEQQEAIARRKAGIGQRETVVRERFEVIRFR